MASYAEVHYREKLLELVSPSTEWVELGCGRKLLASWMENSDTYQRYLSSSCKKLVGIDAVADDVFRHPYLHERVVGDLQRLPFGDNSFSLSTARFVVEHIADPALFVSEVSRILKPGGRFLFVTPNYLYYQILAASVMPNPLKKRIIRVLQGRAEQDIFQTYYRMNTRWRVTKLLRAADMEIESLETIECPPQFFRLGGPLMGLEGAITAALRCSWLESFRAVIVAVARKPETTEMEKYIFAAQRQSFPPGMKEEDRKWESPSTSLQ
jgi:SAM-dependent methyltransferase